MKGKPNPSLPLFLIIIFILSLVPISLIPIMPAKGYVALDEDFERGGLNNHWFYNDGGVLSTSHYNSSNHAYQFSYMGYAYLGDVNCTIKPYNNVQISRTRFWLYVDTLYLKDADTNWFYDQWMDLNDAFFEMAFTYSNALGYGWKIVKYNGGYEYTTVWGTTNIPENATAYNMLVETRLDILNDKERFVVTINGEVIYDEEEVKTLASSATLDNYFFVDFGCLGCTHNTPSTIYIDDIRIDDYPLFPHSPIYYAYTISSTESTTYCTTVCESYVHTSTSSVTGSSSTVTTQSTSLYTTTYGDAYTTETTSTETYSSTQTSSSTWTTCTTDASCLTETLDTTITTCTSLSTAVYEYGTECATQLVESSYHVVSYVIIYEEHTEPTTCVTWYTTTSTSFITSVEFVTSVGGYPPSWSTSVRTSVSTLGSQTTRITITSCRSINVEVLVSKSYTVTVSTSKKYSESTLLTCTSTSRSTTSTHTTVYLCTSLTFDGITTYYTRTTELSVSTTHLTSISSSSSSTTYVSTIGAGTTRLVISKVFSYDRSIQIEGYRRVKYYNFAKQPSVVDSNVDQYGMKNFYNSFRLYDLWWQFYSKYNGSGYSGIRYRTGTNVTDWSPETYVCAGRNDWAGDVGVVFHFDGTYVYLAWNTLDGDYYYVRVQPHADGTVTVGTVEHIYDTIGYVTYNEIKSIAVDSDKFVYIGVSLMILAEGVHSHPYVFKSSFNNGTFGPMAPGYPYALEDTITINQDWQVEVVATENNKVVAFFHMVRSPIYAKVLVGGVWSGVVNSTDKTPPPNPVYYYGVYSNYKMSTFPLSGDIVGMAYTNSHSAGGGGYDVIVDQSIVYRTFNAETLTFYSYTVLLAGTVPLFPILTRDSGTGKLFCVWDTGYSISYRRLDGAIWSPTKYLLSTAQYYASGYDEDFEVWDGSGLYRRASQSFTPDTSGFLKNIEIYCRRSADDIEAYIDIYVADSEGKPSGNYFASTHHTLTQSIGWMYWEVFPFTDPPYLSKDITYCFVVRVPVHLINYIWVGLDESSASYSGGNCAYTTNAVDWTAYPTKDLLFYANMEGEIQLHLGLSEDCSGGLNIAWTVELLKVYGTGSPTYDFMYYLGGTSTFLITDMEGCGDWVFANQRYYHFEGTFNYPNYTHLVNMKMNFTDGANWISLLYNQSSEEYLVDSTPGDVINSGTPYHTHPDNDTIVVTFPIYFKSGILDAYDVDVWMYSDDDLGASTGWNMIAADYFNIYNLGGKAEYDFNGAGKQTPAGDVFYLQVTNATDYARANVTFRKMQHAHILFGINVNETLQGDELKEVKDYNAGFQVEVAFWYCDPDDVWVKGLSVVIDIIGNDVSEVSSNWVDIHWRIRWYDAQGILLRTDDMSSYNHAFVNDGEDPTGNPLSWMWVDMWYNNINGSRVIGGRVTSYEIGIWEHAWWAGGSYSYGWGNVTQSMCFTDLKAHDGDIISSAQLDLMKLSFNLTKPAVGASAYTIRLSDFDIFTVKRIIPAQGDMLGIDTPSSEFEPTKKPDLPAGGFLGGISAMLRGIGGFFVAALAGAAGIFISAVDGILSTFGFGTHTFSDLMSVISALVTNLGIWTGYVATQISNMISFIGYVIIWVVTFIQYVMSTIIWFGTNALYLFVFPLQMLAAFFTGGKFTLPFSSIEADFAGSFPVVSAFLAITPIFTLIFFMQWFIQDGIFAIPGKVISIFNTTRLLFDAMFWIFRFVWNLIVSLINFIKGFIPTMGGGGGQLPEA